MSIDAHTLGPLEPIYTFVGADGTNINLAVSPLRAALAASPPEVVCAPIDGKLALSFCRDNIVDFNRCLTLMRDFRGTKNAEPIILCHQHEDSSHGVYLVDGHHRYVCHAALRAPYILAYILPKAAWTPFTISGLPNMTQSQLRDLPTHKFHP